MVHKLTLSAAEYEGIMDEETTKAQSWF